MTQPMRLSLIISADAKGVAPATGEARREIEATKQTTASLAGVTTGLATANDEAARAARNLTQTLAGQSVVEKQLRDNVVRLNSSMQMNTANIAAQFQDIGVTAAMGMSPLQIALQQGMQLQSVLGPMGAAGTVRALGAAFLSLLSPVSLVTLALTGLTAYGIQYFMQTEEVAKSADEALDAHAESIRALKAAYGEAASGLKEFADKNRDVAQAQNIVTGAKLAEELEKFTASLVSGGELLTTQAERIKSEIDRISGQMVLKPNDPEGYAELSRQLDELMNKLANSENLALVATDAFAPLRKEIDAFGASVRAGTPDYLRLQNAVAKGLVADPTNKDLIRLNDSLGQLIAKGVELQSALDSSGSAINRLGSAAAGQTQILRDFVVAMSGLGKIALPDLGDRGEAARLRDIALNRAGGRAEKDDVESQYQAALKRIDAKEQAAREKAAARSSARSGQSEANAYRDVIKSADDRIAQIKKEIELTGRAGAEAEALRYEQEMLSQATDKGHSIDEKQIAQIKAKAAEYGKLKAQLAATRLEQDLMFERDQLFRSPVDQRVAATMRSAGLEVDLNSAIAGQIRWNEQIATTRELFMDIGSGIINDLNSALEDGKITWEEWGDIGLNILDKISARLIDMALDAGINSLMGGLFGGFGGGGGMAGAMSVVASGGYAGLYAKGGVFGSPERFAKGGTFTNTIVDRPTLFSFANGSKFGEMGEAGAEAVMPLKRDASGRLGVISAGNDNGGGGSIRAHITVGVSVDRSGELQAYVKDVAQSEGTKAAVTVVRENNQARETYYQNGGRG